jgi:APA family basic amino acid/polyamine antiporter
MSNQTTQDSPQLLRKMNLLDSTFLVIGAIVGSGIFMTTGFIAEYLPSPLMILIVWLLGGFFALSGALAFAELGAMYPRAGGQYIYLREAYGPWAGFLYGWGFFWIIECGGVAALAVGFAVMQRWLQDYAYRTSFGIWVFILAGGLGLFITLLSVGYQTLRAATANPADSLRYE